MRRAFRQTALALIFLMSLCAAQDAGAQTGAKTEPSAATKKVTVTLVRWPYT